MDTEIMKEALQASESGKSTFPRVVDKLVAAGVESYFADLIRGEETFYMPSGETHVEKMSLALGKIADEFSQNGIASAIRAAQSDEIRYPEFVKASTSRGRRSILGVSHRQKGGVFRPERRVPRGRIPSPENVSRPLCGGSGRWSNKRADLCV
jgi:uncharacterized protein YbcV (DUF1398 family)